MRDGHGQRVIGHGHGVLIRILKIAAGRFDLSQLIFVAGRDVCKRHSAVLAGSRRVRVDRHGFSIAAADRAVLRIVRKPERNALDRIAVVVLLGERQLREIALDGGDGIGNGLGTGHRFVAVIIDNRPVGQAGFAVGIVLFVFLEAAFLIAQSHAIGHRVMIDRATALYRRGIAGLLQIPRNRLFACVIAGCVFRIQFIITRQRTAVQRSGLIVQADELDMADSLADGHGILRHPNGLRLLLMDVLDLLKDLIVGGHQALGIRAVVVVARADAVAEPVLIRFLT